MSNSDGLGAWRVLAIDDDPDLLERVKDLLEAGPFPTCGGEVRVVKTTSFDDALAHLEEYRIDLVVLDIRLGNGPAADDQAGLRTRSAIHETRFVPIVFYTGLPNYADSLDDDPFVAVVTKGEDPSVLVQCVDHLLASGAPGVQRALIRELEGVIRHFMLKYVAPRWAEEFTGESGKAVLAQILARRLSVALTGTELSRVLQGLGLPPLSDSVNPRRYYVIPPVAATSMVGDLHRVAEPEGTSVTESWSIVLTPTCDLVQGKADFALLAGCSLLEYRSEFKDVAGKAGVGKQKKNELEKLLRNAKSSRYHYLPAAFEIPHLVVDFQDLCTVPRDKLDAMNAIASLDSPYAEELQSRFAGYFGRIGTPDLDWAEVISDIQQNG